MSFKSYNYYNSIRETFLIVFSLFTGVSVFLWIFGSIDYREELFQEYKENITCEIEVDALEYTVKKCSDGEYTILKKDEQGD